ncbi:MAG: S24 family peptidase [Ruminococcus sp.]|nr:S24 family peptidase [Ruminococcus sp.]
MTISQRIFHILKEKRLTQKDFSLSSGISESTISDWKKKGTNPAADKLSVIADSIGVSLEFLITGKEKSSSTELTVDEQELLTYYKELSDIHKGIVIGEAKTLSEQYKTQLKEPKNTIFIEFYDLPASAGTGVYLDNCNKDMIEVEDTPLNAAANFALRVSGDSMKPRFHDGDMVLVESRPTVDLGEVGIFIVNGEGFIKEFGGDRLISLNSDYDDIILCEDDSIYCKGKVIGVL